MLPVARCRRRHVNQKVSICSYGQSLNRLNQTNLKIGASIDSVAISVSAKRRKTKQKISKIGLQSIDPREFARPFSRKDIFLQGSVANLREFQEEGAKTSARNSLFGQSAACSLAF